MFVCLVRKERPEEATMTNGAISMQLPSGVDLTLTELQEMATRQQQQIEAQQQMLVAKEQRLKYLKQQELRHQQIAAENERLRTLREKVEAQELKLKKLRALRGQVNEQKGNNSGLTAELETIKALFNEKEKELSVAVSKVEELTRQLESLRNGGNSNDNRQNSAALLELEKLRKDLMARNKLNETQNTNLASQREIMLQRKGEMARMDERIAELQARLRKKRQAAAANNNDNLLNIANRMRSNSTGHKLSRSQGSNVAAVEPYIKHAPEPADIPDDRFSNIKADPKYQTLPYNIKFLSDEKKENDGKIDKPDKNNEAFNRTESGSNNNVTSNKPPSPVGRPSSLDFLPKETIHSKPEYKPSVGHSIAYEALEETLKKADPKPAPAPAPAKPPMYGMSNFAPRPYGSTFSTSLVNRSSITTSVPPSTSPSPSKLSDSVISNPGSGPLTSTPITSSHNKSQLPQEQHDETQEIFITGAPVVAPPNSLSYSSAGNVSRIASHFQQSSTVMPSTGASSSVSPTPTGRGQPVYQIASSRPQPPVQPQRTQDPSSSVGASSSSSSSTTDSHHQSLGGMRDSPSSISPASTSATFVGSSAGTNASQTVGNGSTYGSHQLSNTLSASTHSHTSPSESKDSHQKEDSQDSQNSADNSVNSALSVLKSSHTSSKQPARYTPKGAIANTYLNKLGSSSMDKYRQNMSSLYRDFITDQTYQGRDQSRVDDQKTESPTATVHPLNVENVSPSESPPLLPGAESQDGFKASPAHDLDAERLHYRPNAPKLRRRSSSGETDDLRQHNIHQQRRENGEEDSVFVTSDEPGDKKLEVIRVDTIQDSYNNNDVKTDNNNSSPTVTTSDSFRPPPLNAVQIVKKKTNLKSRNSVKSSRRVSFDPLALLLDASLEGELELVKRTAGEVPDPSAANDEGITALHNAICAGHYEIVKYLVEFGCNVNSPDSDGWTPLHCAASCNNLPMVKILVEHGACIFATTISDQETAAEKCEEDEDGYDGCSEYLYSIQEKLGIINKGVVYAVFDYLAQNADELSFRNSDALVVLRKGDEREKEWWWARKHNNEGYIPRNLLGLFPRVPLKSRHDS